MPYIALNEGMSTDLHNFALTGSITHQKTPLAVSHVTDDTMFPIRLTR